jgi:hypothetical protein
VAASSSPTGITLDPGIAAALRERLPDVAARTVAAVIAEVEEYAGPLRGELGANITHAVELALATFLRLAEHPDGADREARLGPAVDAAYKLGRGEARSGRTMNALLSAYRVGARVAWEQWGAVALDAGLDPDVLVPFAALVFAYIDQLSSASVNGHSDELATTGRVREQYLEALTNALLSGADGDELQRRAARADWTPPQTLTCILATSSHTSRLRSHLDATTLSLPGDAVDPTASPELTVHLVPDLAAQRAALLPRLRGQAWVAGPERPWQRGADSYHRARRAFALYGPGPEVVDTEVHLADLVVTADADAMADLRAQVLQPLSDVKPDVADRLAQTLRSWLLHQGRRDAVATDLVVHPQTVRYRMTQIRELFGDRLTDPATVRDLVVALGRD